MLAKLKKRKRLRLHGFLRRSMSQDGREVLARRRRKGRHSLVVALPKRFQDIKGKARLHIIAGGTARKSAFDGKGNYIKVVKQLVKQENKTPKAKAAKK